MRRILIHSLVLILLSATALEAQEAPAPTAQGARFSSGLLLGYGSGFGVEAFGVTSNLADGLPLQAKLGIGFTSVDAGNPLDARRVFINNATNGNPVKKGQSWDFSLDVGYPVSLFSMKRAFVVGGLRHSRFKGNFKYVGGNEDFDVKSSHWGFGAALQSYFAMGGRFDFVLNAGLDYFFSSTLSGHDTAYAPDGTAVNPREDYTYSDADAAVGQPKWRPILMVGMNYRF
jgi:hypothetical protein